MNRFVHPPHALGRRLVLVPVLLALIAGCCTTCQTPWDYCNAVIGPDCGPNCDFGARYNSRFHPMYGTPPTTPLEPTPAAAEGEQPPEKVEPSPAAEPLPDDDFRLPSDSAL
jgi:hypothetical protein